MTFSFTPAHLMQDERSASRSTAEAQIQARSRLYSVVGRAFALPDGSRYQDLAGGAWERELAEAASALPFSLSLAGLALTPAGLSRDGMQVEYVRLFEVGLMGGPPCSLFAGHHERDRLRLMEELIRFYNFFGLSLAPRRMPDHLTVELEFMHFLAFREAEAVRQGDDRSSYLRAQRDFLERHLGPFLERLLGKVRDHEPLPFFESLIEVSRRFVQEDRMYLVAALAASEA